MYYGKHNKIEGSKPMTKKVDIVTGSSSGIGFETCLLFARNGGEI